MSEATPVHAETQQAPCTLCVQPHVVAASKKRKGPCKTSLPVFSLTLSGSVPSLLKFSVPSKKKDCPVLLLYGLQMLRDQQEARDRPNAALKSLRSNKGSPPYPSLDKDLDGLLELRKVSRPQTDRQRLLLALAAVGSKPVFFNGSRGSLLNCYQPRLTCHNHLCTAPCRSATPTTVLTTHA